MLGMSLPVFTEVHVAISLFGIFTGLVVLFGMLSGHWLAKWNRLFLLSTVLTSVRGSCFHSRPWVRPTSSALCH